MTLDPLTAELLANGPFAREAAPFGLVEVSGPQAGEFLQRLCTQDVLGLPDGALAPAAFLDNKGKVLVTCLVARLGASFWLEAHAEQVEKLAALLERYHFTEKLTIAARPGPCFELVAQTGKTSGRAMRDGARVLLEYERRGVCFRRSHGGGAIAIERENEHGSFDPVRLQPLSSELAECLRIGAGLVRVGLETEPNTLALEADLDDHCSTTKGCYTGQEIVARINTYGHVNRKLCLLHLPAGPELTTPAQLHEPEDKLAVGRVLHAVPVPGKPLRVGLGYLPKDFQALGTKLLLDDGGAVTVAGFAPQA